MDWHPFAEKFPLLEGDDWKAFKESIKQTKGNEQPVTYRMQHGRKQGLDGRNRWKACQELGLECRLEKVFLDDSQVKDFILRRNVHRRHMTPELRREIVAELRGDGHSTRQIAEVVGVSHATVQRDLSSGGTNVPLEPQKPKENEEIAAPEQPKDPGATFQANGKIFGKDGKEYPATKPKPEPRKPKNGAPIFDDRIIEDLIGKLVRAFDDRGRAIKEMNTTEHKDCIEKTNLVLKAWHRWQLKREKK